MDDIPETFARFQRTRRPNLRVAPVHEEKKRKRNSKPAIRAAAEKTSTITRRFSLPAPNRVPLFLPNQSAPRRVQYAASRISTNCSSVTSIPTVLARHAYVTQPRRHLELADKLRRAIRAFQRRRVWTPRVETHPESFRDRPEALRRDSRHEAHHVGQRDT